jgi:hypothetical protein
MVYHGHVQGGTVILDDPAQLPDGTSVEIRVLAAPVVSAEKTVRPWLKYLGTIDDLPPDASQRVDEVLYGHADE